MDGCRGDGLLRPDAALRALDVIATLPPRRQATAAALHRVLAAPAHARVDLPPFTQSAVDGYAVRHADLRAAAPLPVVAAVRAGVLDAAPRLAAGTAQRIYTGGWLPDGADTVVRQEWVAATDDGIAVGRDVARGADVRMRGEELRAGALVAPAGARLTPGLLAALAMAGVDDVLVHAAPRIRVLITGDEVARAGAAPALGQVHDANGPLVASWLAARGQRDARVHYVDDDPAAVRDAIADALATSDLVLTTGGVSVGDHDHVARAARAAGARTLFWKVAQKPGKPLLAALREDVPLLGLPGNPASVLVNLVIYAARALDRLEGVTPAGPAWQWGRLDAEVRGDAGRDQWLRVSVATDADGVVRLGRLPKQASHMLSNLARAGGLAWIPAGADVAAGTALRWLPL